MESKKGCQSFYMHTFQLMLTTYLVCCNWIRTPQKPSLLSPWRILKGEQKQKNPQVFKFLDLTNQQACSGRSLRTQGSLSFNCTDTGNSIKMNSSTTVHLEEASGAGRLPACLPACPPALWLWWTQSRIFFPGPSAISSLNNKTISLWRGPTHLPSHGEKLKKEN